MTVKQFAAAGDYEALGKQAAVKLISTQLGAKNGKAARTGPLDAKAVALPKPALGVPIGETPAGGGSSLHRPYIRKGVRTEVEARAPRTPDGRFIDPNTGNPIDGRPDFGHKPGNEFWRERRKAEAEGLTQKEFNDRMNDPDLYQLEDPSSNRSHHFELPR